MEVRFTEKLLDLIHEMGGICEMDSKQLRQKWFKTFGYRAENAYSIQFMRKRLSGYARYKDKETKKPRAPRRKYTPRPALVRQHK